ncbi:MAG: hypothetical protein KIS85_02475 [Anaerolineales bacterium]|nr:hypothetical protein [Anaerolineales bacterium]
MRNAFYSLLFVLILLLSACSGGAATPPPTPEVQAASPTSPPSPTVQSLLLLVTPPDADATLAAAVAEVAAGYAAGRGMAFEQRQMLDVAAMPAELDTLVVLAPDPGAAAFAAAAPGVRVVAVGFSPAEGAANLSALPLGGGGDRAAAFLAGYVAAITAPDWRAGVLYSAASQHLAAGFVIGAEYFCGACNPAGPPNVDLPMRAQADPGNWQPAADELLFGGVRVVYLTPELENSGAGQYLAGFGVLLVGSGPPPGDLTANWLASVGADPLAALHQQLPAALAGQPLPDASGALGLSHVNPQWLSQGRLEHIALIVAELEDGAISLTE